MESQDDRFVVEDAHLSNIKSRCRRRGIRMETETGREGVRARRTLRTERVTPAPPPPPHAGTVRSGGDPCVHSERSIDTANDHRHKTQRAAVAGDLCVCRKCHRRRLPWRNGAA